MNPLELEFRSASSSPARNIELHGNVPDISKTALLIVDMFNDFDFPGGNKLHKRALKISETIRRIKESCARSGIATIYVNDNFGRWKSDRTQVISHFLNDSKKGERLRGCWSLKQKIILS